MDLVFFLLGSVTGIVAGLLLLSVLRRSGAPDEEEPPPSENERQLRDLNEDLEQLLHIASHDLREPLVGAAGFISLIKRKKGDSLDDETLEFLDEALASLSLMGNKIDDLLMLSRAGRDAAVGSLVLEDAVNSGWALLNGQTHESAAVLSVSGADVRVRGVKTMVDQVFQNLFANSLKYARPGIPPRISVSVEPRNGFVLASVRDNGIGFSQDQADRIFKPFQRLHASDSRYPGTGIGLAIVRKVMIKLGGDIQAKSVPGEGSTFYLTFPLADKYESGSTPG